MALMAWNNLTTAQRLTTASTIANKTADATPQPDNATVVAAECGNLWRYILENDKCHNSMFTKSLFVLVYVFIMLGIILCSFMMQNKNDVLEEEMADDPCDFKKKNEVQYERYA